MFLGYISHLLVRLFELSRDIGGLLFTVELLDEKLLVVFVSANQTAVCF